MRYCHDITGILRKNILAVPTLLLFAECVNRQKKFLIWFPQDLLGCTKERNFVLYSYRYCSSNTWKGFPVRLSSHSAGHCDEAFTGDETWHLPKVESVSNNTYKYHNARNN